MTEEEKKALMYINKYSRRISTTRCFGILGCVPLIEKKSIYHCFFILAEKHAVIIFGHYMKRKEDALGKYKLIDSYEFVDFINEKEEDIEFIDLNKIKEEKYENKS